MIGEKDIDVDEIDVVPVAINVNENLELMGAEVVEEIIKVKRVKSV